MRKRIYKKKSRLIILGLLFFVSLVLFYFCLPTKLFNDTKYSTVLLDNNKELLSAVISKDEQWLFPADSEISDKYKQAVVAFEDKRFYNHIGVDIIALMRAIRDNLKARRIVSGASTISMQTIRLHKENPPRTVVQKVIEMFLALRLETKYDKQKILELYARHAPFGGNVIGIDAACWRYFGKPAENLSWAEASMLAVLPNSPGLIHTEKNREKLLIKRNNLLSKLHEQKIIDQYTYSSAILEDIPHRPKKIKNEAPHLLHHLNNLTNTPLIETTIIPEIQKKCNEIAITEGKKLKSNNIDNLAILVIDIRTNKVQAYVGNLPNTGNSEQEFVDMVQANRSTGSLLKPFLYTASLDDGLITEKSFLPDYPIQMNGFQAENYIKKYDGLIPANRALQRSLNIPFAWLLQQYNIEKFRLLCQSLGLKGINKTSDYYGIPLILGGGEASLWDLTNAYAFMGKTLNTNKNHNGYYKRTDQTQATFINGNDHEKTTTEPDPIIFRAENIWTTVDNLQKVIRPDDQGQWEKFSSSHPIAWKTGTSNGFKDAWAIGVNSRYAIGVWVGNADGEGRPGIIGSKAAAPIFFRVVNSLSDHEWFEKPIDDMQKIAVCSVSGNLITSACPVDSLEISYKSKDLPLCAYHETIYTDESGQYEVNQRCYDMKIAKQKSQLVLSPYIAYYYKQQATYHKPLSILPACKQSENAEEIQIIYPQGGMKIFQPRIGDGMRNPFVLRAFHSNESKSIYWHLDEQYLGETSGIHEMKTLLDTGRHELVILDDLGKEDKISFEIVQ